MTGSVEVMNIVTHSGVIQSSTTETTYHRFAKSFGRGTLAANDAADLVIASVQLS